MVKIKLNQIKVLNYNFRDFLAQLEISFTRDGENHTVNRQYVLRKPEDLFNNIFLEIKSKDSVIVDDPTLDPVEVLEFYSPIIVEELESVETQLYHFLRDICEKAARLKKTRSAQEHTQLREQFDTLTFKFDYKLKKDAGL